MKILIAGGGVGGLALAQAVRRGGLDVAVYERDPTPETRHQGYRIHINADGDEALRACLPPSVLDLVRRTSGTNDDVMGTWTHRLEPVMSQTFPGVPEDVITNVDRNAFRAALLSGLEDVVHFGRAVTGYEIVGAGRVRVSFAGGGFDEGDLLVGTDGVGSAVRRQLLPHAVVDDLGVRCIYGRMALNRAEPPAGLRYGFNWVADDTGLGAGFAPVRYREAPLGAPDYLMVTLVASPERLGGEVFGRVPVDLWRQAVEATDGWHPEVRRLVEDADRDSFLGIAIRAGRRVEPWKPGPVTLLGDAAHAMPPAGGVGANTALQDAATLAGELLGGGGVAAYERVMIPRGFDTVERSVEMAVRMFGASAVV